MVQPVISIILPTYNDKAYLPAALKSITSQSYSNFELIVIDDGSSDGCEAICRDYASKDHRVRYFRQPNQGASSARNLGLEQAHGEWLCFVDSDDILHHDFLQNMLLVGANQEAEVVVCHAQVFNDQDCPTFCQDTKIEIENLDQTTALAKLLNGTLIPNIWARLYRRHAINGLRFETSLLNGEDFEFSCRSFLASARISITNESLYAYRKRPGSVLSTPKPKLLEDRLVFCRLIREHLMQAGLNKQLEQGIRIMAATHIGYYGMKDLVRGHKIDWDWFDRMRQQLWQEFGLDQKSILALPLAKKSKKMANPGIKPIFNSTRLYCLPALEPAPQKKEAKSNNLI